MCVRSAVRSFAKRCFGLLLVGTVFTAAGLPSSSLLAAELSLPTLVASGGDRIDTSVRYTSQGAVVAAFQFDLEYDPSVLSVTATIGSAGATAGKVLATAVLPNGNLRFLVLGLNQNVITDGSVVDLTIQVSANSHVGPHELKLLNAVGASPGGETVRVDVHSGQVIRVGPPPK